MVDQLTVTERDLRTMLDVIDRGRQAEPDEVFPRALMRGLADLVPADDITFQVSRPFDQQFVAQEEVTDNQWELDTGWEKVFWRSYWGGDVCSRPQRTGDYETVWKLSDYQSARQMARSPAGEWVRLVGVHSEIAVPFPARGAEDRRLLLFRWSGRDFSERERLLLQLLRPHLVEVHRELERRRSGIPELTSRQLQLLRLVADGHSNAQIAHRLFVAEGTVRKHLENIYERLGVTSRTAAVATAFPVSA